MSMLVEQMDFPRLSQALQGLVHCSWADCWAPSAAGDPGWVGWANFYWASLARVVGYWNNCVATSRWDAVGTIAKAVLWHRCRQQQHFLLLLRRNCPEDRWRWPSWLSWPRWRDCGRCAMCWSHLKEKFTFSAVVVNWFLCHTLASVPWMLLSAIFKNHLDKMLLLLTMIGFAAQSCMFWVCLLISARSWSARDQFIIVTLCV